MTISIGGITLSDHLLLLGIEEAAGVAMSSRRTLGGRMVVDVGPSLTAGRLLSLRGENHFTFSQISSIKSLEALGQAVSLVHPRGTFSVHITGVEVDQTIPYSTPAAADWYSGVINLLEV